LEVSGVQEDSTAKEKWRKSEMSDTTVIQWCDSTLNLMAGCSGCELWDTKNGNRHCYAGAMTEIYAGKKGWPLAFDRPIVFPERMDVAEKWRDLTGTIRPRKPWLNGYPRVIFLNDMGDTFTDRLDPNWLAPYLSRVAATPHVHILLTKRAKRMSDFFSKHPLPENVWRMTTVTTQATVSRLAYLTNTIQPGVLGVSIEPMLESITLGDYARRLSWVIVGFESGEKCRPGNWDWMRRVRDECAAAGTPLFVKQGGGVRNHRGELSDMPEDLRIREMPRLAVRPPTLAMKQIDLFAEAQ
jgi:protein gp37